MTVDVDLAYDSGRTPARHSTALEASIYRIVQEALNNVVKHSGATHARVAVNEDAAGIRVTVEDDGCGFVANETARQGFGLIGMRERAEQHGGDLQVTAGPAGGTRVVAAIPLPPAGRD